MKLETRLVALAVGLTASLAIGSALASRVKDVGFADLKDGYLKWEGRTDEGGRRLQFSLCKSDQSVCSPVSECWYGKEKLAAEVAGATNATFRAEAETILLENQSFLSNLDSCSFQTELFAWFERTSPNCAVMKPFAKCDNDRSPQSNVAPKTKLPGKIAFPSSAKKSP